MTESFYTIKGFPGGSEGKASACSVGDLGSILGWEDHLERKWQPSSVFLPGESHGQRSLGGYGLWGCKESDTTEQLHFTLYCYLTVITGADNLYKTTFL